MFYLIISIFLSVLLFLLFKSFVRFKVNTFLAIVVNYVICVLIGLIFLQFSHLPGRYSMYNVLHHPLSIFHHTWVILAFIIGVLFVFTFYLMALTAQKVSITLSTVANKMSLVIPVIFSLFVFKIESRGFTFFNILGIITALPAIYLCTFRPGEKLNRGMPARSPSLPSELVGGDESLPAQQAIRQSWQAGGNQRKSKIPDPKLIYFLPLSVFILGGVIDTMINYTNYKYIGESEESLFPLIMFVSASLAGIVVVLYMIITQQLKIDLKSITAGIILGIPNYFSIYFLLKALTAFNNNGALVFPIFNIGIIMVSAILAYLIFKEELLNINKIGLAMAVLAIFLIYYQELRLIIGHL
ncbi:MAG: hypothetical protein FVQ77_15290 [Cytophagales bacterium]|nr:hypothetical protein [Cytophagales bacterium]